jgi:hypothetical protein
MRLLVALAAFCAVFVAVNGETEVLHDRVTFSAGGSAGVALVHDNGALQVSNVAGTLLSVQPAPTGSGGKLSLHGDDGDIELCVGPNRTLLVRGLGNDEAVSLGGAPGVRNTRSLRVTSVAGDDVCSTFESAAASATTFGYTDVSVELGAGNYAVSTPCFIDSSVPFFVRGTGAVLSAAGGAGAALLHVSGDVTLEGLALEGNCVDGGHAGVGCGTTPHSRVGIHVGGVRAGSVELVGVTVSHFETGIVVDGPTAHHLSVSGGSMNGVSSGIVASSDAGERHVVSLVDTSIVRVGNASSADVGVSAEGSSVTLSGSVTLQGFGVGVRAQQDALVSLSPEGALTVTATWVGVQALDQAMFTAGIQSAAARRLTSSSSSASLSITRVGGAGFSFSVPSQLAAACVAGEPFFDAVSTGIIAERLAEVRLGDAAVNVTG